MMQKRRRTGVFIDGANIFYSQRHLGWQIDFSRLMAYFMGFSDSVEARYYVPESGETTPEQAAFYRMLQANGYGIVAKPVKRIVNRETGEVVMKGNLDVELVVDAMRLVSFYDLFILMSGDSDFLPLLRALKEMGKEVEVYSTRGLCARELWEEPDTACYDVADIRSRIELVHDEVVTSPEGGARGELEEETRHDVRLPRKGEVFTGTVISVKPYGIFLSNPFHAKCLLPLSFLGVETRISNLPGMIQKTDLFEVTVFDVKLEGEVPQVTVKLCDRLMSGLLEERARAQFGGKAKRQP
ncbi:NYN domain-containing protein [Prosthecochloris vibrioformis]|nr:NYN domain-containing protein [Prosthecochloris vibrioformis]